MQIKQSSRPMRIIHYFAIASLGLAVTVGAQSTNETLRPMSLQECVLQAVQHNLDVQIKRFSPDISRYTLAASYGGYDPFATFSGEHDYSLSPGGLDPQGRPFAGNEIDTDRFSTGLQGLLPWGLTYNVGGTLSDQYGTRPSTAIDPSKQTVVTNSFFDINSSNTVSFLSTNFGTMPTRDPFETTSGNAGLLQLRQPLLKNFWIDSTRLQIFLNKRNVQLSELDLRFQIMNTVTAVEQAYYDLIFALENVKVQEKALELAERLAAENKKRVEVGALAPLDEKQSESQVASSRADLLAALGNRDTQQRVLKNLLSDDYSKWEDVVVQPKETLLAMPQSFNKQDSWKKGLSLRPDVLQAKISVEKQGYVVRFQRNQMYPQLDLIGSYGFAASSQEFSGAFDQFRRRDNPFYSYGAAMTIPLGNTSARNNYKAAKATKEQIALELKQMEQNVLIGIENAIAVAKTSFERVAATREARTYAEAALDAEQKKLENGKSTSFLVLQAQRDLTARSSEEIRALADYNKALAQLALGEGTTLERNKLSVEIK
ncbi:MAG: TolC family protein [Verrucomicrobia bacterium]|nr:TolC family protein [Verrucomicrobiota bacterium]